MKVLNYSIYLCDGVAILRYAMPCNTIGPPLPASLNNIDNEKNNISDNTNLTSAF